MSTPILANMDFNNTELLTARVENVTSLPAGLGIDNKGRIVFFQNIPYIWNGWRWLGISANKYALKTTFQSITTNTGGAWSDDNEIRINVDPDELYRVDFVIKAYANIQSGDNLSHSIKFTHTTEVLDFHGEVSMWTGIQATEFYQQLDYQSSLGNLQVNTTGYYQTIYSGILSTFGDTQSGIVKLQHIVIAGNPVSSLQIRANSYLTAIRIF